MSVRHLGITTSITSPGTRPVIENVKVSVTGFERLYVSDYRSLCYKCCARIHRIMIRNNYCGCGTTRIEHVCNVNCERGSNGDSSVLSNSIIVFTSEGTAIGVPKVQSPNTKFIHWTNRNEIVKSFIVVKWIRGDRNIINIYSSEIS